MLEYVSRGTAAPGQMAELHRLGDFVAFATHSGGDERVVWTLGSVESSPYAQDLEIRLWERQREGLDDDDLAQTEEGRHLIEGMLRVREELLRSTEEAVKLTENLRAMRTKILEKCGDADNRIAASNAVAMAARSDVENISYRHWQELKSYRLPPRMITTIMRAVMLLFSEDNARDWLRMQCILRSKDFRQRLIEYDPDIMLTDDRREYILRECVSNKNFRHGYAVKGSQAMGPIYYWTLSQLERSEATTNKVRIAKEKIAATEELQAVMKDIHEQSRRMGEYQTLMDNLDEQLIAYRIKEGDPRYSQALFAQTYETAWDRYSRSFAKAEGKSYLFPAYYYWKPTDRIILVLRRNILVNYKRLDIISEDGYLMNEGQIRDLDNALIASQSDMDLLRDDEGERMRRQQHEEKEIEEALFETVRRGSQYALAADIFYRCFDGRNWAEVLQQKRVALSDAFCDETAESLQIPQDSINILNISNTEANGGLRVVAQIQHDGTMLKEDIQNMIDVHPYTRFYSLYDSARPNTKHADVINPVEHHMCFKGNGWESILNSNKDAINQAFINDTANALMIEDPAAIIIISTKYDNELQFLYRVHPQTHTNDEIEYSLGFYEYPELWALYTDKQAVINCHKSFAGDNWEAVLESKPLALEDAFRDDTADALGVPAENVALLSVRAIEHALVVNCTVRDGERTRDEIENIIEEHPYPCVWDLYEEAPAEEDYVQTPHFVAFEGEDWDYVLRVKNDKVHQAFVSSTVALFDLTDDHVSNVVMRFESGGMKVAFELSHPASMDDEHISKHLNACDYSAVWDLYEARPYDEAEKVETTHSLGFEGEDWDSVVEQRRQDVEEAVATGVASALQVEQKDVDGVDLEIVSEGLLVNVKVNHTPLLSEEQIERELAEYPYDEVWALYESRPTDAQERALAVEAPRLFANDRESSIMERTFGGEGGDLVLVNGRKKMTEAFQKDAAALLGVSPNQVVVKDARVGSLIVDFKVVGCDLEDEEIGNRTSKDIYPELHTLYVPRGRRLYNGNHLNNVEKGKGFNVKKSKLSRCDIDMTFDGRFWEFVLKKKRAELCMAILEGTSKAVDVSVGDVEIRKLEGCPLKVLCTIWYPSSIDVQEVAARVRRYGYKEVWDLYEEPLFDGSRDDVISRHTVAFEESDWRLKFPFCNAELREAFIIGTCAACGISRDNISNVSFGVTQGALTVTFDLLRHTSLSRDAVDSALMYYPYAEVWDLYARPINAKANAWLL